MDTGVLRVELLGGLSIHLGENTITSRDNRSRNIWLLLSYLIVHHDRTVSREELTKLLWGEDAETNALKTVSHRARMLLDRLGQDAGRQLLVRRAGGYTWALEREWTLDIEDMEGLFRSVAGNEEDQLCRLMKAAELYRGDFLPMFSSEQWVIPVSAYYQNLYIRIVDNTLSITTLLERLRESAEGAGALFCGFDFFKQIYHAQARGVARSGDAVHICLLTASARGDKLSKRSLENCMENMKEVVCLSLRRGDEVARCSGSSTHFAAGIPIHGQSLPLSFSPLSRRSEGIKKNFR